MLCFLVAVLFASADLIRAHNGLQANPATPHSMAIQSNIASLIIKVGNFTAKGQKLVFADRVLKYQSPLKSIPFYDNSSGCFDLRVETAPGYQYPSYSYSKICYDFEKALPANAKQINTKGSLPQVYTFDFFPCITVLTTYKKVLSSGEKFGLLFIK